MIKVPILKTCFFLCMVVALTIVSSYSYALTLELESFNGNAQLIRKGKQYSLNRRQRINKEDVLRLPFQSEVQIRIDRDLYSIKGPIVLNLGDFASSKDRVQHLDNTSFPFRLQNWYIQYRQGIGIPMHLGLISQSDAYEKKNNEVYSKITEKLDYCFSLYNSVKYDEALNILYELENKYATFPLSYKLHYLIGLIEFEMGNHKASKLFFAKIVTETKRESFLETAVFFNVLNDFLSLNYIETRRGLSQLKSLVEPDFDPYLEYFKAKVLVMLHETDEAIYTLEQQLDKYYYHTISIYSLALLNKLYKRSEKF